MKLFILLLLLTTPALASDKCRKESCTAKKQTASASVSDSGNSKVVINNNATCTPKTVTKHTRSVHYVKVPQHCPIFRVEHDAKYKALAAKVALLEKQNAELRAKVKHIAVHHSELKRNATKLVKKHKKLKQVKRTKIVKYKEKDISKRTYISLIGGGSKVAYTKEDETVLKAGHANKLKLGAMLQHRIGSGMLGLGVDRAFTSGVTQTNIDSVFISIGLGL